MTHPKAKGEKTEAIVLAELVKKNYTVLQPFGDNQRYDFVLDTKEGFKKIQCKTGKLVKNSIVFSTCSIATNTKGSVRKTYEGQIDYFIVYCYELDKVYIVPIGETGKSSCYLRVGIIGKTTSPDRVRFSEKYELKDCVVSESSFNGQD